MTRQLVITEKSSQANDVRAAVAARHGAALAAEGHLLDLCEPEDVNPAWKRWSTALLKPEGLYATKPASGGNKAAKLKAITARARGAAFGMRHAPKERMEAEDGPEPVRSVATRKRYSRVKRPTTSNSQTWNAFWVVGHSPGNVSMERVTVENGISAPVDRIPWRAPMSGGRRPCAPASRRPSMPRWTKRSKGS